MKVYVVTEILEYDSFEVKGVFTNKENADLFAFKGGWFVEETELDPEFEIPAKIKVWEAEIVSSFDHFEVVIKEEHTQQRGNWQVKDKLIFRSTESEEQVRYFVSEYRKWLHQKKLWAPIHKAMNEGSTKKL